MHSVALPKPCQVVLRALKQRHGIDFGHYMPGSLLRRIALRMQRVGAQDYADYATYLASTSDECDLLLNTLLINHTAFFRDPDVWGALASHLAALIAERPARAPLRIWSAGCSTGQEPYSLAMLLAELVGPEQVAASVTIYATDVDAEALQQVRQGRYDPWAVRMVPQPLLDRYFCWDGSHATVCEPLRRAVVPARHNLLTDAPLSQIDLLLCRNVLIYLTGATQERVAGQLCAGLAGGGLLVLGKTEGLFSPPRGLHWLSREHRIAVRMFDRTDPSAERAPIV
ncbi:MAG TPA: protein-glutamate O-methyltransferase CheR [Roseiflexaceae bacterium]|nr:protein-glutamate O-methyltransferase CheR [Roseiflexaceae bacterium]